MRRTIAFVLVLVLVVTTFLSPFQPLSVAQASYSYSTRRTVFKEEQNTDPSQIYPIEEPDRSSPQPSELYPIIEPPADYLTFSQDIEAGQNASVCTPPISDEKLVAQYPRIKVDIEPAIYIEGKPIILTWSIDNYELLNQNSSLEIHLPQGFDTQNNTFIADDNGVVSTTPNETQQTLEIIKNDSFIVQGDLFFEIVITNNDEIKALTTVSMPIEGFHLAGTSTQPIFEAGLPDAQPLVQISSSDSYTANDLLFHSHLPRTHTLPGISKSGYPLEVLAVNPQTGKNVTQFSTPLELSFTYPEGFVEPEREADLQVFYLDEASQLWYPYETSVNTETNTLNITTDHLTVFDIGVDNWQSFQPPILESYQVSAFTGAATYSYPLPVFEGANGLTPNLSLNYNSQVVDEGSVWTQASWVGLGWSLETASITRDMHSTDKDLSDDTFILGMNGIGGRLLPVKTEGNRTYYRLQNESFDKIYSDNDLNTFTVLTKDGFKYTFGATENSRARYDKDRNCSSTNKQTWSWLLSSVEDRFGNRIDYSYEKEKKTGCQNDIAVYPKEITYGSFKILFETGDRQDYLASWESTESKVLFGKKRLNRIHFNVNGEPSKIIQLGYAGEHDEANSVQPGVKWKYDKNNENNYALTTTLVSIQLLSAIDGAHSPAVKFEYKDSYASPINESWIYPLNIHLTKIDNSLGGVVQFEYKPYFLFDDFNKELRHARWRFGIEQCNGTYGTSWESLKEYVGCSQNSSYLAMQLGKNGSTEVIAKHSIPENIVKPGSKYRLLVEGISISQNGTGTHFGFGIPGSNIVDNIIAIGYATDETNGDDSCSLQQTPGQVPPCEGTVTLPGNYSINDAVLFILNTGSYIKDLQIAQFITRYAVIKCTETDEVTGKSASWHYEYPEHGFNMNTNEGGYVKKHREYRGFRTVTITRDDGLKVVQTYSQSDTLKGQLLHQETYDSQGHLRSKTEYTYYVYRDEEDNPTENAIKLWDHTELANDFLKDKADLNVSWIRLDSVTQYQYEPVQGIHLGTRTDYSYETDIDRLKHHQLSRLESVTSSVYNGDAFVTETETHYTYAEHVVTDDLFLSQQISEERLLGWNANNNQQELRQKLTFYDSRHQPNQSKTWIDSDSSGNKLYAQVEYSYHQNGSLQQIRTWPDLVGINDNPTGRLSQTTYSYDGTFPTLVNTETKGSPGETQLQTTTSYHAQLGVPIQVVLPNGAVESAGYDGLGRIRWACFNEWGCNETGVVFWVSYDDTAPWNMTVGRPGMANRQYYYNGFGALLKEYVLGAEIDGAAINWLARSIDYTPYGQIERECDAGLCRKTYYDSLGRLTGIFRVNGEEAFLETSFEYGAENLLDIGKMFYTASTNANDQVNKQYKDARGQVRKNLPPPNTGPAVSFEYDVLGQLIKTTYGGAESTIGYNAAGQKIWMNDADMGEWDYVYDAMGNLTSQINGNRQTTWLSYDGLNRLTGKEFSTDDHDITYTYDENGHIGYRTSMTDASGEAHWTYDLRGRMIEEAKTG